MLRCVGTSLALSLDRSLARSLTHTQFCIVIAILAARTLRFDNSTTIVVYAALAKRTSPESICLSGMYVCV
jgi:hypothetical protein